MQSLHYNNGSIKLTRERSTMVSRWEANEVARWIRGLAGIQPEIGDLFLKHNIDGAGLSLLLRDDLIRMGITKIDQQLILMHSIDLLLTLVDRLSSETLALFFMRIHCAAATCYNLLKQFDDKSLENDNSNVMNSPEFYSSINNLSDAIVVTCHWLGRLPFIENTEYIDLRRKIIKFLVQIRILIRNLKLIDKINMAKSKLILEIKDLRTTAISLIRQNKDSLFSSDCYLIRVHLRRPNKNDVNIEYTTMADFTHVISNIETHAKRFMGSGFSAINIGDEIIEINNQVVIGWDPSHFNELLCASTHFNEICLLVKKMPRHQDDEIYTKRLADGLQSLQRPIISGRTDRDKSPTQSNRTALLEQEAEIVIESDDETLYQSKRLSQIKREQHSSLPDLSGTLVNNNKSSNQIQSPSTSPMKFEFKSNNSTRPQSAGTNQSPSKSSRKTGFESYFSTFFRSRQDTKSIIADGNDSPTKDHPQLVYIKRIDSINKKNSSNNSIASLQDEQILSSSINKSESQISLSTISSTRSSLSNIFKSFDLSEKNRHKNSTSDVEKTTIFNETNSTTVTNKPPFHHRKSSEATERCRIGRSPSNRKISCKDLGKGDCEGFLYRYLPKGTLSLVSWRLCWCVLKDGTLYIFKSKDDKNQEIHIKLEGKNVSPTPEKRKYAFRIADETNQISEYFCCSTRDEMAKWMNKMGLAAINFNIDDSKIAGFNKGFVVLLENSPLSTPIIDSRCLSNSKHQRNILKSSIGDSENEAEGDSILLSQKTASNHSSTSDMNSLENNKQNVNRHKHSSSSSSTSLLSLTEAQTKFYNLAIRKNLSSRKGHQRTCSSPIRFPPAYENEQKNLYVNTVPKFSDSDLSNEQLYQQVFLKSQILNENLLNESHSSVQNQNSLILESSGGFSTPIEDFASKYDEQTSFVFPSPQQTSNLNGFFVGYDEFSSLSSRSTSYDHDRPNSLSEDQFSPSIQSQLNELTNSPTSLSSEKSSQQNSPSYIPICSSTSKSPLVKDTNFPINYDKTFISTRSESNNSIK